MCWGVGEVREMWREVWGSAEEVRRDRGMGECGNVLGCEEIWVSMGEGVGSGEGKSVWGWVGRKGGEEVRGRRGKVGEVKQGWGKGRGV